MTDGQEALPVRRGPPVEVRDQRLEELRRMAWVLDSQFRIPGTNFRFGVDAIIGLVPGLGDFAGAAASLLFILQAARLGASKSILARMATNVAIETLAGAVPGLGDIFDATFKANKRNYQLIERLAIDPETTHVASRKFVTGMMLGIGAVLLLIGILAVVLGILLFRALAGGRGPIG
jgi:hypothetical protein